MEDDDAAPGPERLEIGLDALVRMIAVDEQEIDAPLVARRELARGPAKKFAGLPVDEGREETVEGRLVSRAAVVDRGPDHGRDVDGHGPGRRKQVARGHEGPAGRDADLDVGF